MEEKDYYYNNSQFIIKNYNKTKTFANFLPGVAGMRGIPLWAFYVNRAQLISGFGLQDKNHPFMLFHSANKAYEIVAKDGFRTFIKCKSKIYEPFSISNSYENKMVIESHKVSIEETNTDLNIKVIVSYFGLPNEELAALVRNVRIINLNEEPIDIEILDGISEVIPAGIRGDEFKSISNLLQSWMDVECLDEGFGFYKLRGSTGDHAEVSVVKEGNFYLGFDKEKLLNLIADKDIIFSYDTSKTYPFGFVNNNISSLLETNQVNKNKVPSAFLAMDVLLEKDYEFYALAGHTHSLDFLRSKINNICNFSYIKTKEVEAKNIIDDLVQDVETKTSYPEFNAYIKQNYLDNLLRGGYPLKIGKQIYHLYARKHGDLERDYNFFSLSPEYYSTGPGNFRDVCQNRRLDSLIYNEVKFFNVFQFGNLIQMDGYNPLSVNGVTFELDQNLVEKIINSNFGKGKEKLKDFFLKNFTPGDLVNFIERFNIEVNTKEADYLEEIVNNSKIKIETNFGEGYWIDHFTYFLDLVESYEAVYPDQFEDKYLNDNVFMYYQSPIRILNQEEKSLLIESGKVRQYKSLEHLENPGDFIKVKNEYYKSNLYVKLLILALNKFSLLDPDGFGIEMEAGKPGWNDAMNGLPGLYGSGVSETIELKRIINFLILHPCKKEVELPEEVVFLYNGLKNDYSYDLRVEVRESYRRKISKGLSGSFKNIDCMEIKKSLESMNIVIKESLERLFDEFDGIIPTYLTYDVTDYKNIDINNNDEKYQTVKPLRFKRNAVSSFLEAPARLLKTDFPKNKLSQMFKNIKKTDLYDKDLKQYRTSVSLENDSYEIGRIKAFTPGWLERESNFLHMTYKYLLGLIKAELYDEFFEEIKTNLVCFMNPEVYGRSILENSSFIATSNNPNPNIHGQGFFARLSGSTVETLNIWIMMFLGEKVFDYRNNELVFQPKPIIEKSFFTEDKSISFKFLRSTTISYHLDTLKNTYDNTRIYKYELIDEENNMEVVEEAVVRNDLAKRIRNGYYKNINIYIK